MSASSRRGGRQLATRLMSAWRADLSGVVVAVPALEVQHPDGVLGARGVPRSDDVPAAAVRAAESITRREGLRHSGSG